MNYLYGQANNRGNTKIIAAIVIAIVLVAVIAAAVVLRRRGTPPAASSPTTATQSPPKEASMKSLNNELNGVSLDAAFNPLLDEHQKDAARLQQ
ncbi:hypothetical protein HY065_02025 [Candidatus Berkelbacteria bacterium]|nr:hypothetical protein [Candidatus Berkelbacteria bacterium]